MYTYTMWKYVWKYVNNEFSQKLIYMKKKKILNLMSE